MVAIIDSPCSLFSAVLLYPGQYIATPGGSAVFICVPGHQTGSIQWLVNGSLEENLNLSNVEALFANGTGLLIFHWTTIIQKSHVLYQTLVVVFKQCHLPQFCYYKVSYFIIIIPEGGTEMSRVNDL